MGGDNVPAAGATEADSGPLTGIRVCDFTHGVAGPYTTMLLADLGADIWKIEKPQRGDATRYMNMTPRFRSAIPESGGDYFLAINRNKRSVTIDLGTPEGRDLALRLAAAADLVVSNFRPGVMERLGLGYEAIRTANPRVIYASLSAYGERGPLAGQPGMDVAVQARSGVMSITGYGGMEPVKPGVSLADFAGGSHLTTAVLAALYERERTGAGGKVSISLLDATMLMLINYSVAVLDGNAEIEPMGSGHPQLVPFQAFPTAAGYIVIGTGTNRLFADLCRVLGIEEVARDERFASNADRVANRRELIPLLEEPLRDRSAAEWMEVLEKHQIPCAPVNTMAQALSDPQLLANGMVRTIDHPDLGKIHQLGSPYTFNGRVAAIRRPPPRLGEHTAELLAEVLKVDDQELDALQAAGIV
jgi:crotonobetainyl-CoA:carnitine CoA-transferase CaiB-like acyl-CoA transferase